MEVDKRLIQGKWLKQALDESGVSIYSIAKTLGIKPDKYYRHINDKNYLSGESLAMVAKLVPSINLHYVLTGEGTPLL